MGNGPFANGAGERSRHPVVATSRKSRRSWCRPPQYEREQREQAWSGATRGGAMRGQLLVIGGAESHDVDDDAILERFVALAGGEAARLVVIATASENPADREKEYVEVLRRLGVEDVTAL